MKEQIDKSALMQWLWNFHYDHPNRLLSKVYDEIKSGRFEIENPAIARPIDDWHEDFGDVLWWRFPVEEPPYCGTPLDSSWPNYHTHWTPIIVPEEPK